MRAHGRATDLETPRGSERPNAPAGMTLAARSGARTLSTMIPKSLQHVAARQLLFREWVAADYGRTVEALLLPKEALAGGGNRAIAEAHEQAWQNATRAAGRAS